MTKEGVVLLAGSDSFPSMVYNYLEGEGIKIDKVIVESPVKTSVIITRRIKRIGLMKVIGQILHRLIIIPYLNKVSKKRRENIIKEGNLDTTPVPEKVLKKVSSVNSRECREILTELNPAIIVAVGTRIIGKKTLKSVEAEFINIHGGITPAYRGMHCAYWALSHNDPDNCGVTIHKIDEGIDTGNILFQDKIEVTEEDNYLTYTYLQLLKALPLLKKAIQALLNHENIPTPVVEQEPGPLYYQPTIWEYISNRVRLDVK